MSKNTGGLKAFNIRKKITERKSKAISCYLNDINSEKTAPISKEQEQELFKKYKEQGCQKSKERIISANIRFVVSVAKEYSKGKVCLALADLISVGNIGLLKAVERFDYSLNHKFISYAVWWIRQAIIEEIKDKSNTIRIPHNILVIQTKRDDFVKDFYNEYHCYPNDNQVSQAIKTHEHNITLLSKAQYNKSLNEKVSSKNSEDRTHQDIISNNEQQIDDNFPDDKRKIIFYLCNLLTERERSILFSFYGLKDGRQNKSFETVAKEHFLTRERVRQIYNESLRKLRVYASDKKLSIKDYLS